MENNTVTPTITAPMSDVDNQQNLKAGIHNLLINCARLKASEKLLIVAEDPVFGWYDEMAPLILAQEAKKIGAFVTLMHVGEPGNDFNAVVDAAVNANDCTLYFARIGDQDRFSQLPPGKRSVMCYIRDIEMLASQYCIAYYPAFREIKNAIDNILLDAEHVKITCPLGTHYEGRASQKARREKADVAVLRFPLGVPLPLIASEFSGKVALAHFLTPTGSKSYQPNSIVLDKTSFVTVENGIIVDFSGDREQVAKIRLHYNMVANKFGIERDIVHSWHAGIHPGCNYLEKASDNPDRWSNSVFTNPRFLHFHTCGNYAPAEICWMVLDHTICVDGTNLWQNGRLCLENFTNTNACLTKWPQLKEYFANPAQNVGLPGN